MSSKFNKPPSQEESIDQLELMHGDELDRSLRHAHERFGIDINAAEIVSRSLDQSGFSPIIEDATPSVKEWIHERLSTQGYPGYCHGSFVQDISGNIGFAKVHYGPDNTVTRVNEHGESEEVKVGGPKREAEALQALIQSGYEAPPVYGYTPKSPEGTHSDDKSYELLVIKAYLPEEGAVRKREDWSPDLARKSAQTIATFNKPVKSIPYFENESIALPVEDLLEVNPRNNNDYDRAVYEELKSYKHLDDPIVVHGDAWFNNIITKHDDSEVMFIDWELAGPGYQGQDAGRKLWDLTLTDNWDMDRYTESADAFTQEWCKTEDDRVSLRFGIVYESLRWVSDRVRDIEDPSIDEATRVSLRQEIDDVKIHTLNILENIK